MENTDKSLRKHREVPTEIWEPIEAFLSLLFQIVSTNKYMWITVDLCSKTRRSPTEIRMNQECQEEFSHQIVDLGNKKSDFEQQKGEDSGGISIYLCHSMRSEITRIVL